MTTTRVSRSDYIIQLNREISELKESVRHLSKSVDDIKVAQEGLISQANRWKGGLAVVLGLGSLLGWFANKLFH